MYEHFKPASAVSFAAQAVTEDWKDALGLSARDAPELYSDASAVGDVPHARPIRTALRDLGADSVFCIEGTPVAVFFAAGDANPANLASLHSNLWNQGLASVLAVVCGNSIRIYSLAAVPPDRHQEGLEEHCLVEVLHRIRDAVKVRSLIHGMESGRYWQEHDDRFHANQRVDGTLLNNLKESDRRLQALGLVPEASQALLMQAMFIAYLEDRKVIGRDYISEATDGKFTTFGDILKAQEVAAFYALFRRLNQDFNGDLFVKPCSFDRSGPRVRRSHLPVLARFRSGMVEMGQDADQGLLFWAYNFELIPVELISAVYDRFLSAEDRTPKGQFHTPMHLASSVVSQLWDAPQLLAKSAKTNGRFLDPACGSGIFLACIFKRLCENWRQSKGTEKIQWRRLLAFLDQLTGLDIDASAVRVAIFSLYIALLEEVRPPDIRKLMAGGKILPRLWGAGLRKADFFSMDPASQYDVVIGNPPWRSGDQSAARWCLEHQLPAPDKQAAWGFVWKALQHLKKDGKLAFLLPAMPFLHTHSKGAVAARTQLLSKLRANFIINYADLRRQLFDRAIQPTALFTGGRNPDDAPYWFHYWAPKAAPSFAATRLLTICDADKSRLDTIQLADDPLLFNKRLWMTGPEDKLFRYLERFPRLCTKVAQFRHMRSRGTSPESAWTIGQGFQPAKARRVGQEGYGGKRSDVVGEKRFLPAVAFRALSPELRALVGPRSPFVRRRGFERGFEGPRVLVTQGTGRDRLRAAYADTPFTFQDAIQAIVVPAPDVDRAKVLAAMLNSKLMFWFAFHASASIGSERPIVHQDQLLDLPFPAPEDLPEEQQARSAAARLAGLIDKAKEHLEAPIPPQDDLSALLRCVDGLVYEYFDLADQEIHLVEDTVNYVAPSLQPAPSSSAPIWQQTKADDRRAYALALMVSLADWGEPNTRISVTLIACDQDLAVVKLRLCSPEDWAEYHEQKRPLGEALATVSRAMGVKLPGNLHRLGNFGVYAGNDLYLVKPNMMRFWTQTAARVDAEEIVADLWRGGQADDGGR